MENDDLTLLRVRPAFEMLGHKPSSGYLYVKAGLITEPVAYGPAGKRLPLGEIRRIAAARIAGASDDDIRALVQRLHLERKARASCDLAGDAVPKRDRRLRNAAEQARSEQSAVQAHTPQPTPTPTRRAPPPRPPVTKRTPKRTPKQAAAVPV